MRAMVGRNVHMNYENQQENIQNEEPIAAVGISCIFPGIARDVEGFSTLLSEGMHVLTDIPSDRFLADLFYDKDLRKPNSICTKKGAFLDNISGFDAEFFDISAREAIAMDPQQRLLLECCWHAIEDAGITRKQLSNTNAAIYIGASNEEYKVLLERSSNFVEYEPFITTSAVLSGLSGRIAHVFDIHGPAITINTHYSSSLVAIHLACENLVLKNCDVSIAGGVQLLLTAQDYILMSHNKTLSPAGYCKTFDSEADGFGFGEGCGVVVLKRLNDALKNNDRIYAVIRGTAINQNGYSKNIAATSKTAQKALISELLNKIKINPKDISYIEAHGTGTPLGDITEMEAISEVFSGSHSVNDPLYVGSVKTNIGHLGPAAGIAGLLKVILLLKNKQVPKHLHFKHQNQKINLDVIPALIPRENISLDNKQQPLIAGVSSFGITGTNAHVIVEEYSIEDCIAKQNTGDQQNLELLCISAKTLSALKSMALSYVAYLNATTEAFSDICYTAIVSRTHFENRLGIVASSKSEAIQQIQFWLEHGRIEYKQNNDPWLRFYQSAADLYVKGEEIEDLLVINGKNKKRANIPKYKFEHIDYWLESQSVDMNDDQNSTDGSSATNISQASYNSFIDVLYNQSHDTQCLLLSEEIKKIVRQVLKIPETTGVQPEANLIDLGLNSLLAVEFREQIVNLIGEEYDKLLFDTLIFNYPTITALVNYLIDDVMNLSAVKNSTIKEQGFNFEDEKTLLKLDEQMKIAKTYLQSTYKV